MRRRVLWVLLLLPILAGSRAARGDDTLPASLEGCDAMMAAQPGELQPYVCYWLVGRNLRQSDEAARRLRSILEAEPGNPRAQLYLGLVEADRGRPEAEDLFLAAVEGFSAEGNPTGEVLARESLVYRYRFQGRSQDAQDQIEAARAVAEASGDRSLVMRVQLHEARLARDRMDYGRAWVLYKSMEAATDEATPYGTLNSILEGLGSLTWATGRHAESLEYYRRQAELQRGFGVAHALPSTLYNIALLAGKLRVDGEIAAEDHRRLLDEALEAALAAGDRFVEAQVRLLIGQEPSLDAAAKAGQIRRALALLDDPRHARTRWFALRLLSGNVWFTGEREEALRLAKEALDGAQRAGDLEAIARGRIVLSGLHWMGKDRQAWVEESDRAIEAIEKIRDLQRDDQIRARVFSEFAFFYDRSSAHLLDESIGPVDAASIERAFRILERRRARVLLDHLDAARVSLPSRAPEPLRQRRARVLEQIALAQRQLTASGLLPAQRESALAEVERLEAEEAAARRAIAEADARFAALRDPRIPSLAQTQRLLGPDEALLTFQVPRSRSLDEAIEADGGSWVFVVTRDEARVHPLPKPAELENAISIYLGLLERRDRHERRAGARLYRELLDKPLADLPPSVNRLLVVPDRSLHRLPLHALRPSPEAEPLAARYEITRLPSVTIWQYLEARAKPQVVAAALALADPRIEGSRSASSFRQAAPWLDGLKLGPLPNARIEAEMIARYLGPGVVRRLGEEASEEYLKSARLSDFGILHLAAHALVDDQAPERSAILLSPGSPTQDGLLQFREIVDLDLAGRLVVLSACGSATGEILSGEGVVSLARALFQAGARSVVGSLWPLRDDEAAGLVGAFYRRLGRGRSVSEALAGARRERLEAGAPTSAWAGLVVLGDGGFAPVQGSKDRPRSPMRLLGATALTVLGGILLLFFLRRRS